MKTIEEHALRLQQMTKRLFEEHGDMHPIGCVMLDYASDEQTKLVGIDAPEDMNPVSKLAWYATIRQGVSMLEKAGFERDGMAVVLILEAWFVEAPLDEVENIRPSESDARKECVIITIETAQSHQAWIAQIRRADDGAALMPFARLPADTATGSAVGFFA